MKAPLFWLLLLCCSTSTKAQIQDGSKVWTTTLSNFGIYSGRSTTTTSTDPDVSSGGHGFVLSPEATVGTIRNNRLLSIGLNVTYQFSKQVEVNNATILAVAPVVSYQRLYPISQRFYFSPFIRIGAGYQYKWETSASEFNPGGKQDGVIGTLALQPIAFAFTKSERTNFLIFIGGLFLDFSRLIYRPDSTLNDAKTVSTNFSLQGSLNGMGLGIQKTF